MHDLSNQLDQALEQLDAAAASRLKEQVAEAISLAYGGEKPSADPTPTTDALGYPAGYFEATAGSFADEPLERPDDLPLESREPW